MDITVNQQAIQVSITATHLGESVTITPTVTINSNHINEPHEVDGGTL